MNKITYILFSCYIISCQTSEQQNREVDIKSREITNQILSDTIIVNIDDLDLIIVTNMSCNSNVIKFKNGLFKYVDSENIDLDIEMCDCESIKHKVWLVNRISNDTIILDEQKVIKNLNEGWTDNFFIESISIIGNNKDYIFFQLSSLFSGSIETIFDKKGNLVWYEVFNKNSDEKSATIETFLKEHKLDKDIPVVDGVIKRDYLYDELRFINVIKT